MNGMGSLKWRWAWEDSLEIIRRCCKACLFGKAFEGFFYALFVIDAQICLTFGVKKVKNGSKNCMFIFHREEMRLK